MQRNASAIARDWAVGRLDDPRSRGLATALLVFAGYYVGARIGLALTFAPSPISVLWPPNAILFAALLIVPRERAWIVIASALPAHLLAELQGQVPLAMVMSWFVSNVTEALIGAVLTRWLMRAPTPFETLSGTVSFLLASAIAVFVSSFVDSGLVVLNRWGEGSFWQLWETRMFANVATAWALVPLIVSWSSHGNGFVRSATPARIGEALALVALVVAISFFAPSAAHAASGSAACMFLPLLLWAVLRFNVLGASTTFALVAFLVTWQTGHLAAPYDLGSPSRDALAVHVFIIVVAPALLCLAAVLSERRRVAEKLRAGERRFRLVLEATRDTIFDRDVKTGRVWWDGNGLEYLGYDASNRPQQLDAWRALIHPDDLPSVQRATDDALRSGAERLEAEFRVRRRDGTYAHVRARSFVVRNDDGTARQLIGSLSDVSDRHEIDEMSASLAHAARLASVGELAATIAHEINQPMSAILSNVDAAEMLIENRGVHADEIREILADIRSDGLRASEVIRHVRSFAHKQATQMQAFSVDAVIADALRMFAPTAHLQQIEIATALAAVPPVRGDPIHMQQVLLNLMLNASDAMSSRAGGTRRMRISTALTDGDKVEVAVADSGPGIAAQDVDRLFDSFFSTKREGMGLGLSIARSLITGNGGRIWVENAQGGGAVFRFTLPVAGDDVRSGPRRLA